MALRTTTALLITAAMAVVVVGARLPANASADNHVVEDDDGTVAPTTGGGLVHTELVGEDAGWNLNVDYHEWASDETLNVGDVLEFRYPTGGSNPHNVVQLMNENDFNGCNVPAGTFTYTSGDDIVPLDYAGPYYFISSLNGDCQSGMKLSINVAA